MNLKQLVFVLFLFNSLANSSFGQQNSYWKSYAQSIEFKYKLGFLIAHRESMAHLPMSHFHTAELSYIFETRGFRGWEQAHNNPKFAILGTAIFNSNREVLGNCYGVAGRVILPKKNFGKNRQFEWNNDMAFGLGYLPKKFDLIDNPKNVAIGTNFNLLIILGTEFRMKYQGHALSLGLDFTHFSNGGTKKPNLGLNIPSIKFGLNLSTQRKFYNEELVSFLRNDLELLLFGVLSAKNNYEFEKNVYPVMAIGAHLSKKRGTKYRYVYGLDLSFSEANRNFLTSPDNQSVIKTMQLGVYNGWEIDLNKVVFSLGMGIYGFNPRNPHGWFYHRIGGRFNFSKHFYFHGFVRSHFAKADFFESGIGYKIPLK